MIRLFSFVLCVFACVPLFAQEGGELLEWNEYYDLTWDDFQAPPVSGTFGDAGTAVQIKAKPYMVGKKVQYDVTAYFDRRKSWSGERTDALLRHESLHFDLAELYARKIRKRIDALIESGRNDVDFLNAEIRKILIESNEADERYDRETLHGAILKRQEEWETKVNDEMKALAGYKKKKKVIGSVSRLKTHPVIFRQPEG
jgi:hypothetical protein